MNVPILCPYTDLRPETKTALAGYDVTFVDVSGGDDWYFWALQGAWHRGAGILVVEHDIVPSPGAIEWLQECACDWGGVPYQVGLNIGSWLGCVRFSPEIMRRVPDAFDRMERTHWQSLDGQLLPYLWLRGEREHRHWPAIQHLHDCGDANTILANCPECGDPIRFEQVRNGPGTVRCIQGHWVSYYSRGF
jgi:hypothetical protein